MGRLGKGLTVAAVAVGLAALGGVHLVSAQGANDMAKMSFFITSKGMGKGANLGGLGGADAHCGTLASVAGAPRGKVWRAYLSVPGNEARGPIHARDRIGAGPWFNAKGAQVAASVDDLHSANNKLGKENSLTEQGLPVKGVGDTPNEHDILTGSDAQGRLAAVPSPAAGATAPAPTNMTCNSWTSSEAGAAMLGHFDKQGGGANPTSWNAAHASRGCSQANLVATGGAGYFYCFSPTAAAK